MAPEFLIRHVDVKDCSLVEGIQRFAQPLPGERPYAGWLYARGIADAATPRSRRSRELTLVVGVLLVMSAL